MDFPQQSVGTKLVPKDIAVTEAVYVDGIALDLLFYVDTVPKEQRILLDAVAVFNLRPRYDTRTAGRRQQETEKQYVKP